MLKIENVTKYYGKDILALDNISFEIQRGEIVGFLGPNGAGKTTTMRILTGYLASTSGTASIAGHDINKDSIEVKKRIGYLPENNPVYEDMGVIEYLEFIAEIRQLPESQKHGRIKHVISVCGLKDVLLKNIGELSRGYKQRLGFAQAILHDPDVLVLDEPTSGLDPNQAREVRSLIRELKKEKTVILSTHILSEVQSVCDRVLIIHKGKIIASGTANELQSLVQSKEKVYFEARTNKDLTALLRSIPQVNEIETKLKEDSVQG